MGPSFHFSVPQPPGLEGCSFFGPQIRSKFSPEKKKKLPIISKSKNYGPEMQVWIQCKIRHTLLSKEQRKERGDGSRRDDRTGAQTHRWCNKTIKHRGLRETQSFSYFVTNVTLWLFNLWRLSRKLYQMLKATTQ